MSAARPTPVATTDSPRVGQAWLVYGLGFGCLAVFLASELYLLGRLGLPLDDSWIHLQFARSLARGDGLAFNPGVLSTASTAPLWTALLSLGFSFGIAPLIWAKLLSAGFYLAAADAAARLAGELGLSRGWRSLAAVLTLATPWLAWAALSGMEICCFTALSLWGIILHLRERRVGAPAAASLAVLALASLARPEGLALLCFALLDRLLRCAQGSQSLGLVLSEGRRLMTGLLAVVILLLPTLLFYRSVGGSLLPSTFAAKAAAPSSLIPSLPYLRTVVDIFFRNQPLMFLACGAGILCLIEQLGTQRDRGLLPALWLLGLPLAYSLLAPPTGYVPVGNFGRYFFPLLPVMIVLGLGGIASTARRQEGWGLRWRTVLVMVLLMPQLWQLADMASRYTRTVANVEDSDVAAARWLAERLPPEALLAVQDVGAIKYMLPNTVLDLAGLVTPEILPALRGSGGEEQIPWEARVLGFLSDRRPDYLVVFPTSFPLLTRSPGFEKLKTFEIQENLAMIGPELAIFSTPWTTHPLTEPAERSPSR